LVYKTAKSKLYGLLLMLIGYGGRVAKRKGFSDDLEVMAERLAFAREGITWTPERRGSFIRSFLMRCG